MLREARQKLPKTTRKVAEDAHLSQTFISAIELGERVPELDRCADIADAYGLDVSLVCWTWVLQFAPRVAPYMAQPTHPWAAKAQSFLAPVGSAVEKGRTS
jgi:transcriptional regulator with XRE-family HTH domain